MPTTDSTPDVAPSTLRSPTPVQPSTPHPLAHAASLLADAAALARHPASDPAVVAGLIDEAHAVLARHLAPAAASPIIIDIIIPLAA